MFTITNNGSADLIVHSKTKGTTYGSAQNEAGDTGVAPFDTSVIAPGASADFSEGTTILRVAESSGGDTGPGPDGGSAGE